MRQRILVAFGSGVLFLFAATPALAAMPTPRGGPEFGQHVANMAPEHPKEHGVMFGECVSAMAQGECPHEH